MDERVLRRLAAKLEADRRETWELMSPGERLMAGPALFDLGLTMMRAGIRMRHPSANDEFVEAEVLKQLRNARRFEAIR